MKKLRLSLVALALGTGSLSACSSPSSDQGKADAATPEASRAAPAGANGKIVFMQCAACHAMEAGAANKVGPNLAGVVGRKAGTAEGFAFSPAMTSSGLTWTREELDRFLKHPMQTVPGTKMAFGGISNDAQRAALIDYLAGEAPAQPGR